MAALLGVDRFRAAGGLARLAAAGALAASGLSFAWAMAAPPPAAALSVPPGRVIGWGNNDSHEIDIPAEAQSGVTRVAAGGSHSLALKGGKVIAWGNNSFQQTEVPAAAQSGVVAISAGGEFSLALKSNGTIVAWGRNREHQTEVPSLPGGYRWFAIGAGYRMGLAVATNGTSEYVCHWGDGGQVCKTALYSVADGEAGNGAYVLLGDDGKVRVAHWSSSSASLDDIPAGLSGVTWVDMGWWHALALRSDGTVAAWGNNEMSQTDVPAGLSGVTQVAAGWYFSLALKSDGTIAAWGRDDYGETTVPAAPAGTRYSFIAGGLAYGLAIASPIPPAGPVVPGAPLYAVAWPGDGRATVWWTAPATDGGTSITEYSVTSTPDGMTCRTVARHCTVTGLTNGTAYTFTVTASNAVGSGTPSDPSLPVTPMAGETPPVAPDSTDATSSAAATESAGPTAPPAGGGGSGGLDPVLVLIVGVGVGLVVAVALFFAYRLGLRKRPGSGGSSAPPGAAAKPRS